MWCGEEILTFYTPARVVPAIDFEDESEAIVFASKSVRAYTGDAMCIADLDRWIFLLIVRTDQFGFTNLEEWDHEQ